MFNNLARKFLCLLPWKEILPFSSKALCQTKLLEKKCSSEQKPAWFFIRCQITANLWRIVSQQLHNHSVSSVGSAKISHYHLRLAILTHISLCQDVLIPESASLILWLLQIQYSICVILMLKFNSNCIKIQCERHLRKI